MQQTVAPGRARAGARGHRARWAAGGSAGLLLLAVSSVAAAEAASSPAILQMYEARWDTIRARMVDVFQAGYGVLADHWQKAGGWTDGDFNGDGWVDLIDVGIVATYWQAGAASPTMRFTDALAATPLGVPEPASALLLAVGAAMLAAGRESRRGGRNSVAFSTRPGDDVGWGRSIARSREPGGPT